jgi:hypothetical protein
MFCFENRDKPTQAEIHKALYPRRSTHNQNRASLEKLYRDGIRFGSGDELKRYDELRLLQHAGEISKLTVHTVFTFVVAGYKVGSYKTDFTYHHSTSDGLVVEDVKGFRIGQSGRVRWLKNREFELKRKLMWACFAICVHIVNPRVEEKYWITEL